LEQVEAEVELDVDAKAEVNAELSVFEVVREEVLETRDSAVGAKGAGSKAPLRTRA